MAQAYDAIIIGGGHNGLVCGSYLAKAGLKVLVLERRHVFGGAAVTEEFAPGFRASIFSYVMSILHPRIIARPGAAPVRARGPAGQRPVLPARGTTTHLIFSDDMAKTQASFARFSQARTPRPIPRSTPICRKRAKIVRQLLFQTPVDPTRRDWRTFKETARLAWEYRKIGTPVLPHRRPADPSRRRLPVAMVRERRDQGGVRLLRLDRHLRRPEDAGLGLRHHAPPDGRA